MPIWKEPMGYEGLYEVSDDGLVRSVKSQRLLAQHPKGKHGYLYVSLSKDGNVRQRPVHYLVLETHDRPKRDGESPRHKNFNYQDNRIRNLEWGTTTDSPRYALPTPHPDTLPIQLREGDQLFRADTEEYFFVERNAAGQLILVRDEGDEEGS